MPPCDFLRCYRYYVFGYLCICCIYLFLFLFLFYCHYGLCHFVFFSCFIVSSSLFVSSSLRQFVFFLISSLLLLLFSHYFSFAPCLFSTLSPIRLSPSLPITPLPFPFPSGVWASLGNRWAAVSLLTSQLNLVFGFVHSVMFLFVVHCFSSACYVHHVV